MAVFRVEKNKGYTVMSNHHLRNEALTLKVKGLLSQMLSLPDTWDYTLQGLALITKRTYQKKNRGVTPHAERTGTLRNMAAKKH